MRNVRVWEDATVTGAPGFSAPTRVGWDGGRFRDPLASPGAHAPDRALAQHGGNDEAELDGSGLWLIPGLVDAHLHAGWQAFDEHDRDRLTPTRTRELVAQGLHRTLASGFTSARDAGGLTLEAMARIAEAERPRLQASVALIDRATVERVGGLERAVTAVLDRGAKWVKLVATAGVASPAGSGLEPLFTAAEVRRAAELAAGAGAGLMVHAWGGTAIDHAIEVADAFVSGGEAAPISFEHGILLTADQAARAAKAGLTYVPTLRIYTLVQAMIAGGELPASFEPRVREAVHAHPNAVRIARDAGLAIALGTDYGTPSQHGTGRLEFDAIVESGLTPTEALVAATRGGAALMASVDPDQNPALAGRIAPGAPADAVLLNRDPREPGALSAPGAVAAVILAGRVVAPAFFERNPS